MSAGATQYVYRHSPYKGVGYTLHLLVADVVNDLNENRFWMSPSELAAKARTTRESASKWLWQAAKDGLLEVIADKRSQRNPKTGYSPPSEFRFLEPELPVVYESKWKAKQGPHPEEPRDDSPRGGVTTDHAAEEPRDENPRGTVMSDHAAIREPAGQGVGPRDERSRVTQNPLTKEPQLNQNALVASDGAVSEDETAEEDAGTPEEPRMFPVPAADMTASAIVSAALRDAGTGIKWPTPKWRKGDDENPNGVHTRQVQQVRQALRGWALGRLLDGDEPESVTKWAIELCRRTPAARWSAERLHDDWERMTGRACARGGVLLTADDARGLTFNLIAAKLQDHRIPAEDREMLHNEVQLRVKATLGVDNGALPMPERDINSFMGIQWRIRTTASTMHDFCDELGGRDTRQDPAAAEAEAAFRAIAGMTTPSTTRSLTEGSYP